MNIIKQFFTKKKINKLDLTWSEKDISVLEKNIFKIQKNESNRIIIKYAEALHEDVMNDNPASAITIIESIINQEKINSQTIEYRLAYLYARVGNNMKALKLLKNNNSEESKYFKICLNKIKGEFTMTKEMLSITKIHGVHEHFGVIESLVRKNNFKIGAELGVFHGYHLNHLLEACRNLKMIAVDLYENVQGTGYDDLEKVDFEKIYVNTKNKLDLYNRCSIIRKNTIEASKEIDNKSIDFVFIDADHRYEGVKADISAWQPKVKNSGIISGHDIDEPSWPGVRKAVEEWCELNKISFKTEQGFVWWAKNEL
jgi:predicted O-methyltransferase YrrM